MCKSFTACKNDPSWNETLQKGFAPPWLRTSTLLYKSTAVYMTTTRIMWLRHLYFDDLQFRFVCVCWNGLCSVVWAFMGPIFKSLSVLTKMVSSVLGRWNLWHILRRNRMPKSSLLCYQSFTYDFRIFGLLAKAGKVITKINVSKLKSFCFDYKTTLKPSKTGCPRYIPLFSPAPLCACRNASDFVQFMKSASDSHVLWDA